MQDAEIRGGRRIEARGPRRERVVRAAEPEAEILERGGRAVLRAEQIAGVDDPRVRVRARVDAVALDAREIDDDRDAQVAIGDRRGDRIVGGADRDRAIARERDDPGDRRRDVRGRLEPDRADHVVAASGKPGGEQDERDPHAVIV